jgi:hypothetical protein
MTDPRMTFMAALLATRYGCWQVQLPPSYLTMHLRPNNRFDGDPESGTRQATKKPVDFSFNRVYNIVMTTDQPAF